MMGFLKMRVGRAFRPDAFIPDARTPRLKGIAHEWASFKCA